MTATGTPGLVVIDDCWNRIGVRGDQSCEELGKVTHCNNCRVFAAGAQQFLDRPSPPGYIEERTTLVAAATSKPFGKAHSVLVFRIGEERLAFDTRIFVEMTEPRPVHRVTHRSNQVFLGLVNVHGQLEPCVSLSGLLHIAPAAPSADDKAGRSRPRMLVLDVNGRRLVFGADEVHGVHTFAENDLTDPPSTVTRGVANFILGVVPFDEAQVGYLDGERVFAALERSLG